MRSQFLFGKLFGGVGKSPLIIGQVKIHNVFLF
jgi:hypothetical protein